MSTEIISDTKSETVTGNKKQRAESIDKKIKDNLVETALFLKIFKDEELYKYLPSPFESFEAYCKNRFEFGERQARKYYLVASKIEEISHFENGTRVPELIENGVSGLIKADNEGSLRNVVSFFNEIGINKAAELCAVESINMEPISLGGLPTNWAGEKITVEEIKTSKNLKKEFGPEALTEPVSTGKKVLKPKDPKQHAREAVSRANRFLDSLKTELSNFATDEKTYQTIKKDLKQIGYQLDHLATYCKEHKNFIETHEEPVVTDDMFPLKEVAGVLDVAPNTLRNMAKKIAPKYFATVSGTSGKEQFINPEGLPHTYRVKWQASRKEGMDLTPEEIEMSIWKNATDWQRKKAGPMLDVVKKTMGLTRQQMNDFIDTYNVTNSSSPLAPLAEKTVYRWQKKYREKGLQGLLPKHGKNEGLTKVNVKDLKVFRSYYANQNQMALKEARKKTMEAAALEDRVWRDPETKKYYEIDPESGEELGLYPSPPTFLRALENEMGGALAVEYARKGEYKMRQSGKLYTVDRDYTMTPSGTVWVSDHRQLDVQVTADPDQLYTEAKRLLHDANLSEMDYNTLFENVKNALALNIKDKKPVRLWLTAWMDMKSLRWLNCYLHADAPNSDHVLQSFKWAVEEAGGLPEEIYIDNGMDYRCKDFAGKPMKHKLEVDEGHVRSLMHNLRIEATFAIPKNARAKPIERHFRQFIDRFEKMWPTYTGKNSAERPESTIENVKRGDIPNAIYFKNKFMEFVPMMNATEMNGKEHDGQSPNEVWMNDEPALRSVPPKTLSMFTMRSLSEKQLKGNGYYDAQFKKYYFNEIMFEHVGERVYGLRDPYYPQVAEFFLAKNGKHICTGLLQDGVQANAKSDEEIQKLKERLELQRKQLGMLNTSIRDVKPISVDDALNGMQALLEVNNAVMDMTGTDGNIHIMEDNDLNRLAKSISNSKTSRKQKENSDLSKLLPAGDPGPKKQKRTPLDGMDVSDMFDGPDEETPGD
jgi:hypothetical protein